MTIKTVLGLLLVSLLALSCKETNDDLLDKALNLSRKGKKQEAIKLYGEVIKRNSKIQLAYYNRGHCYMALKNYPKALVDFNKVISLQAHGHFTITYNPNMPYADEEVRGRVPYLEALYERAIAKYHMDSIKSSFSDFQVCIDNGYEASNCTLWQGNLWYKAGKKDKACDAYKRAKELAIETDDIKEADIMIDTYCKNEQQPLTVY